MQNKLTLNVKVSRVRGNGKKQNGEDKPRRFVRPQRYCLDLFPPHGETVFGECHDFAVLNPVGFERIEKVFDFTQVV